MRLWNKYKVTSIPSLVFVDAATGKVVCRNGLLVVRDDPKGEFGCHVLTLHTAHPHQRTRVHYCSIVTFVCVGHRIKDQKLDHLVQTRLIQ